MVRAMLPIDAGPPARPKTPRLAGKVRVAIGGTLQPRKRQLEAIEAVRILRDLGLPIELNVYGYALDMMDRYISEIQQLISAHDLGDLVRCHGLVSMQKIADDNDVVLMASVDESLPQTLVELMRLGLVGAAGLSGGIDEVIKDHVTGYLTQDMSPRGLADVLLRAINDRNRWPEIVQNARKHIDADYDLASNTEALLALLIEGAQIESSPFGRLKPH
jgi:glycosyltransferase involved in cell wall biosynthesis